MIKRNMVFPNSSSLKYAAFSVFAVLVTIPLSTTATHAQDAVIADRQNCLSTVEETLQPVRNAYCLKIYNDLLAVDEETLKDKPVYRTYQALQMMRDTGQLEFELD